MESFYVITLPHMESFYVISILDLKSFYEISLFLSESFYLILWLAVVKLLDDFIPSCNEFMWIICYVG